MYSNVSEPNDEKAMKAALNEKKVRSLNSIFLVFFLKI